MSKKNSNVILKNNFKDYKKLHITYLDFKKKLDKLKIKSCVVAVSGGPDSLALAALTRSYSLHKKTNFFYVLVNHNIRKNSLREANQVKNLLKKNRIFLNILTNKKKIEKNIQGQARKIRYDLLSIFCKKKKANIILTAHNLEDQVETFFIRLSRGSGLSGLSSMKPLSDIAKGIKLFRPLLETKKEVLIRISKIIFSKYFKDPSNKDKKYLRTKIRNLQKPLLESGIHYEQIIRSINNLASSSNTLNEYYQNNFLKISKKIKNEIIIDYTQFKKLNSEIKIRVINDSIKKLKRNYYNPRSKKVIGLIENITNDKFKSATLAGCIFYKKKDLLCLKIEKHL